MVHTHVGSDYAITPFTSTYIFISVSFFHLFYSQGSYRLIILIAIVLNTVICAAHHAANVNVGLCVVFSSLSVVYININIDGVSSIPNWYTVLFRSCFACDDEVVLDTNSNTRTQSQTHTHTHSFVDIGGIHGYVGLIYMYITEYIAFHVSLRGKKTLYYTILLNKFHSRTLILCCDYLLPPVTTTTTTSPAISVL